MSALANLKSARPGLQVLEGLRRAPGRATSTRMFIASTVLIGALTIGLGNLVLNIATSEGVYQLAHLNAQTKELALNSQILGAQVSSLASDQNLANAAHAMGMVSNANPVFIDVANQKVYGKPMAAVNGTADRISRNLILNSQLTVTTKASEIRAAAAAQQALATAPVATSSVATGSTTAASSTKPAVSSSNSGWTTASSGFVGGAKSYSPQVGQAGSGIPASATR